MRAMANDSRTSHVLFGGLVGMILALAAAVSASEPAELPSVVEALPDLSAELQSTLIDRNGHTAVTTAHIYRSGHFIRYEHTRTDPPEIWIMDYGDLKEYRIYAGDKIYFETTIAKRLSYKAQREGLIPPEPRPEILERRIRLKEDTLDGHPCDMILLVRTIKGRKEFGADYTLIWEARDLQNQWIRVVYNQANFTLYIQDLRNIKMEPINPDLLRPPDGFAAMSPY